MELNVDLKRYGLMGDTGIYVRAKLGVKWKSVDISDLDKKSLHEWLKSRGGENLWAESTVAILLGHDGFDD